MRYVNTHLRESANQRKIRVYAAQFRAAFSGAYHSPENEKARNGAGLFGNWNDLAVTSFHEIAGRSKRKMNSFRNGNACD